MTASRIAAGPWNDIGMDTVSLAGTLRSKLRAIREAGFTRVTVSAKDLAGNAEGVDCGVREIRQIVSVVRAVGSAATLR